MTVKLKLRRGWYYAHVSRGMGNGKALKISLKTQDPEEARRKIVDAQLEKRAIASQADALGRDTWTRLCAGRKVLVRAAVSAYEIHRDAIGMAVNTIRNDQQVIDQFLRFTGLANAPISTIATQHIADFVNREDGTALTFREKRLSTLSKFLAFCLAERWISINPAVNVRVRIDGMLQSQLLVEPIEPLTADEVKRILAAIPRADFFHGATLISFHYGLRLNEVASLEEGNVVMNRLRLFTRKGRKTVDEPLHDDVQAWLEEWRTQHRPASDMTYLFPCEAAADIRNLSKAYIRHLARIGITGKSFHSLRKTAAADKWHAALSELGSRNQRLLAQLVAKEGYRKVQAMLSHSPGSDVTDRSYLPKSL